MPTGSGKTVLAAHVITGARGKQNRVAFTVPLLSLVNQTFEKFVENGIAPADMGVVQGDHPWHRPAAPIQICSVQTLARRQLPEVAVVVVDEAHIGYKVLDEWMDAEPKKVFIGLSATPWRKGMAERWDDLIQPTSIKQLIDEGQLCKFRTFAPSHPDLTGIKKVAGDFHEGQLSERMGERKLIADVVGTWLDNGRGRPTLVFAVDCAHAAKLHAEFEQQGVKSAYVDALVGREDRSDIVERLEARELEVICSVGTMTTGSDIPCVSCISYVRPTYSEMLFVQSIGRGLRVCPSKEDLIVFDHSDTTLRLGLVDTIHHEGLLDGEGASTAEREVSPIKPKECLQCHVLIPLRARRCPACGCMLVEPSMIENAPGELVEMLSGEKAAHKANREWSKEAKALFFGELQHYGRSRGYKEGWAAMKYRERFSVWPNDPFIRNARVYEPSMATLSWIKKSQRIWAESQAKEKQHA
jgi:superfamily II DNA or RNA helicase